MFWRLLPALAVLFWAVMTVLLVRTTYFPGESAFAEVPPRFVLDLFLKSAARQTSTLHLMHKGEKIGHATLAIIEMPRENDLASYRMMARGHVERLQAQADRLDMTWEVNGIVDAEGNGRELEFVAAVPREKIDVRVAWKTGSTAPEVTLTQNGKPLIDTAALSMLLALGGHGALPAGAPGADAGLMQFLSGLQTAPAKSTDEKPHITAREGLVELAGRERRCYILALAMPAAQSIRLLFAETGEIARVELPQDYVLLEPMINGMLQ